MVTRVNWIRAEIECDTCGKPFQIKIDEGWCPPAGWSMHDVAIDSVRSGYTPDGGILHTSSVQHDMALCPACTSKADAIGDDDYQPTRDEVMAATRPAI